MYVSIIFFMYNPYLLKKYFSGSKHCDISREINVKMCIIEKSKKTIVKKL